MNLAYSHQRVRRLRRLVLKRSARWNDEVFVAEGAELVRAALASPAGIESCFVDAAAVDEPELAELIAAITEAGSRIYELDTATMAKVADTVAPQPIMAIVPMVHVPLAALVAGLVVVCAEVRDPGNAGTIVRTADAAGATGVVFCEGSVDLYNPKTVRSTAGSIFNVPVVCGGTPEGVIDELAGSGFVIVGTAVADGTDYLDIDWRRPSAVVVGNEASGLDPTVLARCPERVAIPMAGNAESLNVAVATAVICFEALAQRRRGGRDRTSTMLPVAGPVEHD